MKFKAIIEVVYNVDPDDYGNVTLAGTQRNLTVDEMTAIDLDSFKADAHFALDLGEITVRVEEYTE